MNTKKYKIGILNLESCILILASCILYPASVFAAGVSVSVTGTKVGTGAISSWDIGLIKAAQSVYSCGTAPDVNCVDTGDVYWTVTGSSDGIEDISAIAASSGNWNPGASSSANVFVLKAYDTVALNNSTPTMIYPQLPKGGNFKVGFSFTSPSSSGSTEGQQTITITLTATNWALPAYKKVFLHFIAADAGIGNLGGLSGADNMCQVEATAAGLAGTYKAWLSDSSGNTPITRFSADCKDARPFYKNVDGTWNTAVANSWADLIDGTLASAIDRYASGVLTSATGANSIIRTGTYANGTATGNSCVDWTSSGAGIGTRGMVSETDSDWSRYAGQPDLNCNGGYGGNGSYIYCVEQ